MKGEEIRDKLDDIIVESLDAADGSMGLDENRANLDAIVKLMSIRNEMDRLGYEINQREDERESKERQFMLSKELEEKKAQREFICKVMNVVAYGAGAGFAMKALATVLHFEETGIMNSKVANTLYNFLIRKL